MTMAERGLAMGLLRSGKSVIKVARELVVSRQAVNNMRINVYFMGLEQGVKDKKGRGRKRKSTDAQVALLLELINSHPFKTAGATRELRMDELGNLSIRRVQEILKKEGWSCRRAAKKPSSRTPCGRRGWIGVSSTRTGLKRCGWS